MYRIVITRRAREDLLEHFDYIFQRNPQGAQNVYDAITARIRSLRDFPLASRQGELPGTREVFTTKYAYRIVFRVQADEITILYIRHSAQIWPPSEDPAADEPSDPL